MLTDTSRLQILCARSHRIRREALDQLCNEWSGGIDRHADPTNLQELMMAADTPSLFGDASLTLISASENYLAKHAAMLKQQFGLPVSSGQVVIHCDKIPAKGGLRQAAQKAQSLITCDEPNNKPREIEAWLRGRLELVGCNGSQMVAKSLMHHRGSDLDALLSSIDVLEAYSGDDPISIESVHAVMQGQAEEPLYKFADAFFSGQSSSAINLLYAGRGLEAQQAINALINELRKLLCSLESNDPDEIAYNAGLRYKLNPYAVNAIRKRALGMGKRCLLRLLAGLQQAQRDARRGAGDPLLVLETLILNASRVIRSRA